MNNLARTLLFGGSKPDSLIADAGFTVLRVFTGLTMALGHGYGKFFDAERRGGMAPMLEDMGMPGSGLFWAWMAAIGEFIAGVLLAAGLLTRLSALLMLITMLVAGIWAHMIFRGDPYGDAEHALLFAAVALAFLVAGSGRFSVDAMIRR